MKRIMSFALALVVVCGLAFSISTAEQTVTFMINSPVAGSGTIQDIAVDEIIQKLDERSNGRIKGTKVAGNSMGAEGEVTQAIQFGTLDIALVSDMGINSIIGGLSWAWLPYMITSYEQADEYYINGWISDELTRIMGENGLVRIAATENDFRMVGNAKRPILTMDDFKGLKIRTPEIEEVLRFYELCGALPVAMSTSEVLTALEQKTIDGVDNTIGNFASLALLDNLTYITRTNYMYNAGSIICNEGFWSNLSDSDKALFAEVATEAGANFRASWREQFGTILDKYVSEGKIEVEEVSEELNAELKKIGVQIWEEYAYKYDPVLMERVMADFGSVK